MLSLIKERIFQTRSKFYSFTIVLPIVDEDVGLIGEGRKYFYRALNLPKIGESIFLSPNTKLSVSQITYDGKYLGLVTLHLEPIALFEAQSFGSTISDKKVSSDWKWNFN